jgi:polyhydroxybutyrate depolymerase
MTAQRRSKVQNRHSGRFAATLAAAAAVLLAGCGTAAGDHLSVTASSSAGRLPPIIYRPSGLSLSRKVPLLIALHGASSTPSDMEGLTHFEHVADEHGFVVAYLDSASASAPWNPRTDDTAYVSSEISQLTQSENIDPSRVYVAGFSAGGYETWAAGCQLSNQVAAVAVVSLSMGEKLANSCRPTRPISELMMVGSNDSVRFTGQPGVFLSAAGTTAKWRSVDGCSSPSPQAQQQVSTVLQQTWTSCTDRSAVALYVVQGAQHVWPPYGVGAPQDYPASEAVWAFLSAHTAAPNRPSASVTSLRVRTVGRKRDLVAKFRLGEAVTLHEALLLRGRTLASKTFRLAAGAGRNTTLVSPQTARAGQYTLSFRCTDSYGRMLTLSRTLKLPKPPA